MNKLIIVRHGESIGNANNIIQGKNNNYGLTNDGMKAIRLKTQSNLTVFKDAKRILVSPYKRTIETAEIISDETKQPIYINDYIEEMDAGILSGMNKKIAEMEFTELYRIWKNREDLDKIPNAESGEKLQARVLGFLMQYYDKKDFCDVIVTHAGFIRCLINTVENRIRTYNFSIENGAIFQIEDLFKKINIEKRDRAMNSDVFVIYTANEKYVAKVKKGSIKQQDEAERDLLDRLDVHSKMPKILSMQNYDDNTYCKIIKYMKGNHIYGKLTDIEYDALIESEEKLKEMLRQQKDSRFKVNNLKENVEKIYLQSKNKYIKEISKTILSSKYMSVIENTNSYVLSHNDLNRDNLLFERNQEGKVRVNIIDFESLEYSPIDFQFASMLASGLLLEGESLNKIKETIKDKGKDLEKILFLMQIRLLEGLNFFASKNEYSDNNRKISNDLLRRYFFAEEEIRRKLEIIIINNKGEER